MDLHADARFDRASRIANVRYLVGEIEKWSATRTVVECETHFNRHGIPCSRYNSAADLFDEPQLQHRGAFTRNAQIASGSCARPDQTESSLLPDPFPIKDAIILLSSTEM